MLLVKLVSSLSFALDHNRSSCPEMFSKKGILKTFTKFTRKFLCQSLFSYRCRPQAAINFPKSTWKHLRQSLFLIKLHISFLIKRKRLKKCFSVKFAKLLRTAFFKERCGWLFLLTNILSHPQAAIHLWYPNYMHFLIMKYNCTKNEVFH